MKKYFHSFLIFLIAFSIFTLTTCNKDDEDNDRDVTYFTMNLNGEYVEAVIQYASRVDSQLHIMGSIENQWSAAIQLKDTTSLHYKLVNDSGNFVTYTKDMTDIYDNLEKGSGELEIINMNDQHVKGTFEFSVFNDEGEKIEVKWGEFKVNFIEEVDTTLKQYHN